MCIGCHFLNLSFAAMQHVIERHYLIENDREMTYRESFFFSNVLSPRELSNYVRLHPRLELDQRGWSGDRFVYTMSFPFDIGAHFVRGTTTNKINIICDCIRCPVCGVQVPTEVVTVYPAL